MEKNWIEEIIEFIRKAMNKGFKIVSYKSNLNDGRLIYEYFINNNSSEIRIGIIGDSLSIKTPTGMLNVNINLTKRDYLELDALLLSVEEYNEDMAISEFNNFFGEEENKVVNINDLDNDDE